MPERLTRDEVAHVAHLARLELTDEELDTYTEQLGAVLDHAADVAALDLADVPPTAHPLPLENVLRDDVSTACLDRDEVLAQAPVGRGPALPGAGDPGGGAVSSDLPTTAVGIAAARPGRRGLRRRGPRRPPGRPSTPARARSTPSTWCWPTRPGPRPTTIDAAGRRRRGPGPLAGVPVALKDNLCTRGRTHHVLEPHPRRLAAALRRHRGRAARPPPGRSRSARPTSTSSPWAPPPRTRPSARPATRATPSGCPAAPRAGRPPRWPPGSPPSRSAPTPAARSASRRPCAAWSA